MYKKTLLGKATALALSVVLALGSMGSTAMAIAGSKDPMASAEREAASAAISRYAATQGMVLLENNGALPIAKDEGTKVALFGAGVYNTVKGGTGSGSVNVRTEALVNVLQGFENLGYVVVNNQKVDGAQTSFIEDRVAEKGDQAMVDEIAYASNAKAAAEIEAFAAQTDTAIYVLTRNSGEGRDRQTAKGDYYLSDNEKANLELLAEKFEKVIVALNVGGIVDTNFFNGKGGYAKGDAFNRDQIEGLDALVLMSQAGIHGGYALVDVLNGTYSPSGKLTDTWAINYEDYASAETFSYKDENTLEEVYADDIFVGYRYFDTFGVDVAYPFGYGLSYTDFEIDVDAVTATAETITVDATVKNIGGVAGKEVVQVYFSAPDEMMAKPYQELAAYAKVEVEAGASQSVSITFDTVDLSSYDEATDCYVIEKGDYTLRVGNHSRITVEAAVITVDENVVTEICENQMGLTVAALEAGDYDAMYVYTDEPVAYDIMDKATEGYGAGIEPTAEGLTATSAALTLHAADFAPAVEHTYTNGDIVTYVSANDETADSYAYGQKFDGTTGQGYGRFGSETIEAIETSDAYTLVDVALGVITMEQLVASMSNVELADLVEGNSYTGQVAVAGVDQNELVIGNSSDSVFGAAGETTRNMYNSRYIPNVVMADGPAGLRLQISYENCLPIADDAQYEKDVTYYYYHPYFSAREPNYYYVAEDIVDEESFNKAKESGNKIYTYDGIYYQYCTAFPIGTMLAQTWDMDVIEAVGRAVAVEMAEFGVSWWLAPGMNLHRNPLCGRNFEYYSEDPLISGKTAAAETMGIQTLEDGTPSGVGVTIKHYAYNQQENDRYGSNSLLSERASREIYLKGFEIVVKEADPMTIMSSYNSANGAQTSEIYGLLTGMLRDEWDFQGLVMTDWRAYRGVLEPTIYYGQNIRAVMAWAGNDLEMPGYMEDDLLLSFETNEMRLGDLQKSAGNIMKVMMRTTIFKNLLNTLVENDSEIAAKYESWKAAQ